MSLVNKETLKEIKRLKQSSGGVDYPTAYDRAMAALNMAISLLEQLDHSTANMRFKVEVEVGLDD